MTTKTSQQRIAIYPADLQRLLGKSYRTAARKIADAKKELGKKKGEPITINELCTLYKLDYSQTARKLNMQ